MKFSSILIRTVMSIFFCLLLMFGPLPAKADGLGTSFTAVCRGLLAQADAFGKECLLNAVTYQRYFNGDPEIHNEYLGSAKPGSHFALGCTLNSKHQIAFLGVYYTMNADHFINANSMMPAYVDFDGNIGLIIKNQLINFVAFRAFQTKNIHLAQYVKGPVNCDKKILPSNEVQDSQGDIFLLNKKNFDGKFVIHVCISSRACLKDRTYLEVVPNSDKQDTQIDYPSPYYAFYIEDGGGLIMAEDNIKTFCPIYYKAENQHQNLPNDEMNIIREVCYLNETNSGP